MGFLLPWLEILLHLHKAVLKVSCFLGGQSLRAAALVKLLRWNLGFSVVGHIVVQIISRTFLHVLKSLFLLLYFSITLVDTGSCVQEIFMFSLN